MVLIFSGHANESPQVRREVERAASRGMSILTVRVEDAQPDGAMEYALGNRHSPAAWPGCRRLHSSS